jgi:hypothetical protein
MLLAKSRLACFRCEGSQARTICCILRHDLEAVAETPIQACRDFDPLLSAVIWIHPTPQPLGTYSGIWTNRKTLVLTINNITGAKLETFDDLLVLMYGQASKQHFDPSTITGFGLCLCPMHTSASPCWRSKVQFRCERSRECGRSRYSHRRT